MIWQGYGRCIGKLAGRRTRWIIDERSSWDVGLDEIWWDWLKPLGLWHSVTEPGSRSWVGVLFDAAFRSLELWTNWFLSTGLTGWHVKLIAWPAISWVCPGTPVDDDVLSRASHFSDSGTVVNVSAKYTFMWSGSGRGWRRGGAPSRYDGEWPLEVKPRKNSSAGQGKLGSEAVSASTDGSCTTMSRNCSDCVALGWQHRRVAWPWTVRQGERWGGGVYSSPQDVHVRPQIGVPTWDGEATHQDRMGGDGQGTTRET